MTAGTRSLSIPVVQNNSSPIFPNDAFSPVDASFSIPQNEIISTGSVSISIVLAEPFIFLRGCTPNECVDRPPSLLRGTLVVRISKATRIKSVSLTFKGIARTEWPEGIPSKRSETVESSDVYSHTWPFFNASFPMSDDSSGASMYRPTKANHAHSHSVDHSYEPETPPQPSPQLLAPPQERRTHLRTSSTPSATAESTSGVRALAGRLRRAASPSPSRDPKFHSFNLRPSRSSASRDESVEFETQAKGYRTFEPGEYLYNFELPIPQSLPETIESTYGSVNYSLEATIERPGLLRSNITGTQEIIFIRCLSENSVEANEPIAISKPWEDQLHYDIVISGKAFAIGSKIPIAFKLTPLAKVQLHRIRVFITESAEYYCNNKQVHRIEPAKKFLLQEKLSEHGVTGNLLLEFTGGDEVNPEATLNLETTIPTSFPKRKDTLHPCSTYENIKVHHWIKVVMRISRADPIPTAPYRRKHYEITIDSPIHLLDHRCTTTNVSLPPYIDPAFRQSMLSFSQQSLALPTNSDPASRRGRALSGPVFSPPPFEADVSPPPVSRSLSRTRVPDAPPNYESATHNQSSYDERFADYQMHKDDPPLVVRHRSRAPFSVRLSSPAASLYSVSTDDSDHSEESRETSQFTQNSNLSLISSAATSLPSQLSLNSNLLATSKPAGNGPTSVPVRLVLQRNPGSTNSVDIVDQSSDPYVDPLSSITEADTLPVAPLSFSGHHSPTDRMTPDHLKSSMAAAYSADLAPLLGQADGSQQALYREIGIVSRRPRSNRTSYIDTSADIGLVASDVDDDRVSLASTPSLWI